MDEEKVLKALIKVAKKVFAAGPGVLHGTNGAYSGTRGAVEIGTNEMPRVIVVGIALGVGINPLSMGDESALDLGETPQQITKNVGSLKKKYDLAAKELMSGKPHESFKIYALKHNQVARRFNEALGNRITPDFPYHFIREKEKGDYDD
jgi:hypothetical protein